MRSITSASGRAFHLPGNDIDTDEIMPKDFLKLPTFDDLGQFVFNNARKAAKAKGQTHPFDEPRNDGCSILVVDENFGCGSSREHAPQGIMRRGITAMVGKSFSKIFRNNCLANGIPCVDLAPEDHAALVARLAEGHDDVTIDLMTKQVTAGNLRLPCTLPEAHSARLADGTWDAFDVLLSSKDLVQKLEAKRPKLVATPA
jgi:3-isopropylmalate/(R)-2-methylmalate dehydratase small subunit